MSDNNTSFTNHPQWVKESSLASQADRDPNTRWRPENAPPLSEEQVQSAMKELNVTCIVDNFPRVDRRYADPPIPLQRIGLFSFVPAKGASPDKNGVYGFAKIRGNYDTPIEADQRAEDLIRNDSYHPIQHTYVGRPFPITFDSRYASTVKEVDIRNQMVQEISENVKRLRQDEEGQIKAMQDREQELLAESEKAKKGEQVVDADPYDRYVTLKVKKAQLSWTYLEHMKKMDEVRTIVLKTREEIRELDSQNQDYAKQYFKKYMDARNKVGFDGRVRDEQDNFIRFMVEDVVLPGIDDLSTEVVNGILDESKPKPVIPPTIPPVGFSKQKIETTTSKIVFKDSVDNNTPSPVPNTNTTSTKKKNKKKNKKKSSQ